MSSDVSSLCLPSPAADEWVTAAFASLSHSQSWKKLPSVCLWPAHLKLLHFQTCHLFSLFSLHKRLYSQEDSLGGRLRCGICFSVSSGFWKHDTRLKQSCHNCGQCLLDTENLTSLNVCSLLLKHPLLYAKSFSASQYDYWYYFLHGCRFFAFLLLHAQLHEGPTGWHPLEGDILFCNCGKMSCDTPAYLYVFCLVSEGGLTLFAAGVADTAGAWATC